MRTLFKFRPPYLNYTKRRRAEVFRLNEERTYHTFWDRVGDHSIRNERIPIGKPGLPRGKKKTDGLVILPCIKPWRFEVLF